MNHQIPISIPMNVFHALALHTGDNWWSPEMADALSAAVLSWVATNPRAVPGGATVPAKGYQWKKLFLPEGTMLRSTFRATVCYATVEGEAIIHDGRAISPSAFVNASGCGSRNAWRAIWVRFPGASGWQRAADCRATP